MTTFTPGPWIELDTESSVDLAGVSGWQDIGVEGGNVVAIAVGFAAPYWHEKSLKANASLISAAPDLLEALKEAVEDLEATLRWRGEGWECTEDELLGNARAAIAKAEDRQ